MPKKIQISNFNTVESNKTLKFDSKNVKDFFSNLAKSLKIKLPNTRNKYTLESAFQYYSKCIAVKPFHLNDTSEKEVFKMMQNTLLA